jgi:O-acetyl-ADP-ribose deacetylase (regulator of RNase III)
VDKFKARIVWSKGTTVEFHGPADITEERTEAIVNAANSYLIGGGGVDGAIHDAGGPSILDECKQFVRQNGRLLAGHAMITTGGELAAKYVIHSVGPIYRGGENNENEVLASCYAESIRLAEQYALKSIAFPSISTGAYQYPVHEAADIAISTVVEALDKTISLERVRFVLFDIATTNAYMAAAEKVIKKQDKYRLEKASS